MEIIKVILIGISIEILILVYFFKNIWIHYIKFGRIVSRIKKHKIPKPKVKDLIGRDLLIKQYTSTIKEMNDKKSLFTFAIEISMGLVNHI